MFNDNLENIENAEFIKCKPNCFSVNQNNHVFLYKAEKNIDHSNYFGIKVWENGSKFKGFFNNINNRARGLGIYTEPNGNYFIGSFRF